MSKRKISVSENLLDSFPDAKRLHLQPLQDSAIQNHVETSVALTPKSTDTAATLCDKNSTLPDGGEETEAAPTGIYSLPVEILAKIARCCFAFRHGGVSFEKPSFSCPLAQVSKTWRNIALGEGVITTYRHWNHYQAGDMPGYLESRDIDSSPITLQLGPRLDEDDETADLEPGIIQSLISGHNIQRLVVTSIKAQDLAALQPGNLFPSLERLVLQLDQNDIATLNCPIRVFKDAPRLTHVAVTQSVTQYDTTESTTQSMLELPWPQVILFMENLRNWDQPLPGIFYVNGLTNLAVLTIRMPFHVKNTSLLNKWRSVSLPNLKAFAIEGTPLHPGEIPGFEIIDLLKMPVLEHFGVVGHNLDFDSDNWKERDGAEERLISSLSSFKNLKSLSLSFPRIPAETLRKLLNAVEGISMLDVHVTSSKEDYNIIFEELTVKDDVDTLLPSLESFSFDVANEGRFWPDQFPRFSRDDLFDFDSFTTFINSRRGRDLPSGVSQVERVVMFTDWDKQKEDARSFDSGLPPGVLSTFHLVHPDYWHLKRNWASERWMERTMALDDADEVKQFFFNGR